MRVPMLLRNCKFKLLLSQLSRNFSSKVFSEVDSTHKYANDPSLIEFLPSWPPDEEPELRAAAARDMRVYPDFLSVEEEAAMLAKIEPQLKRMRYEYDHWDNAIEGYRETERDCSVAAWGKEGAAALRRVREVAFGADGAQGVHGAGVNEPLARVHVLDLSAAGHIKPHIDAVRFCGPVIAGLCLCSSAVMRLTHARPELAHLALDALLPRRGLYVMTGVSRYEFTHAVLGGAGSRWRGQPLPRARRVALIQRSRPLPAAAGASTGADGYSRPAPAAA